MFGLFRAALTQPVDAVRQHDYRVFRYGVLVGAMVLPSMAGAQGRVIEEVMVTAQKTEQSMQDVPVSVSTLGAETVQQAGLFDVQDMVQYVPNVKYSSGGATPVLAIRGFGSGLAGRGIESPVGSVIDDVFFGHASYLNDGAFDIQRMEVLRGPQGALFGKNTIAGVMNFHTAPAGLEWEGNISVLQQAPVDGTKYEGGITIPLIEDTMGMRLSFRSNRRDTGEFNSTLDDKKYTQEDYAGRLKLLWLATDTLDVHFNAWYADRKKNGASRPLFKATEQSLEEFRTHDPETEDDPFDENTSTDLHGYFNRRAMSGSVKTEWRPDVGGFDNATVTAILAYAETATPFDNDADFSPIPLLSFATDGPDVQEQRSVEIRFSGQMEAPFGWGNGAELLVGMFGQRQSGTISNVLLANLAAFPDYLDAGAAGAPGSPLSGLPTGFVFPNNVERITSFSDVSGSTQAIFSQLIWYMRDDLDLTLGLRLGRERKEGEFGSQAEGGRIAAELQGQRDYSTRRRMSESEVSPKIALSWHVTDEITLWGNVAKGFKSGGFQAAPLNPDNLRFEAENALSTEIGIKSRLFDGSLVLNATIYRTEFDNLQVILFDGVNFRTLNAAAAISQGFELDFTWLPPWEPLTIAGSIGTTDAYYTEYDCAPLSEDDSDEGRINSNCPDSNGQDLAGEEVAFAPDITASLYPTLRFPLSERLGLNAIIGVDILYQGDFYMDYDLDENTYRPAETKVNVRFGIQPESEQWSLMFNAKNLTGAQEAGAIIDQPLISGNYVGFAYYDEPIYTVDFALRWPGI